MNGPEDERQGSGGKSYRELVCAAGALLFSSTFRDMHWRMAEVAEATDDGDARGSWRKAYQQLAEMKQRGIMRPADEQYLATLKEKVGRAEA